MPSMYIVWVLHYLHASFRDIAGVCNAAAAGTQVDWFHCRVQLACVKLTSWDTIAIILTSKFAIVRVPGIPPSVYSTCASIIAHPGAAQLCPRDGT